MTKTRIAGLALMLAFLGLAPAALASHPSHHQMKKVKYLARDVYQGADQLYEKSTYYAHYLDRRERRALRSLDELARTARHFSRQVGRYYGSPRQTERAFHYLIHAYERAVDRFRHLPSSHHLRSEIRCLREAMDDLVYYYGGFSAYAGHGESCEYWSWGGYGGDRYYDRPRRDYRYRPAHHRPSKGEAVIHTLLHIAEVLDDD